MVETEAWPGWPGWPGGVAIYASDTVCLVPMTDQGGWYKFQDWTSGGLS